MSTSHPALSSAADERKARLAKLAGLKRKQPGSDITIPQQPQSQQPEQPSTTTEEPPTEDTTPSKSTDIHLSSRNYDPHTRQPRLGFEASTTLLSNPHAPTIESQSTTLLATTLTSAQKSEADLKQREESGQGGIDLLKIQPKKPNWDLKRELEERKRRWGVEGKMKNSIAILVRERIQARKEEALAQRRREQELGVVNRSGDGDEEGEEVGIEGAELVEGVHLREREEEEEERREREREREEEKEEEEDEL